jgi:hypothetical protein
MPSVKAPDPKDPKDPKEKEPKQPIVIGGKPIDPKDVKVTPLPDGKYKAEKAGKPDEILKHSKSGQKKADIDRALAALDQTTETPQEMFARLKVKVR